MVKSSVDDDPVTLKEAEELALPPGVVTEILPVVAALGTVAAICVALFTVKLAAVPLKASAVAPVRLLPVMVTTVPMAPLAGAKLAMLGAGACTVKLLAERAFPPAVVTEILPLVAPLGTVAAICVALFTVKLAAVPLNATMLAPLRLVPVMVTVIPTGPLAGVKLATLGADAGGGALDCMLPPPQETVASRIPMARSAVATLNRYKDARAATLPSYEHAGAAGTAKLTGRSPRFME
jgi:hypothetical protein